MIVPSISLVGFSYGSSQGESVMGLKLAGPGLRDTDILDAVQGLGGDSQPADAPRLLRLIAAKMEREE